MLFYSTQLPPRLELRKMMNFFFKWFGLKKIKELLDKIPGNGRKTVIGVILVLLHIALGFVPGEYGDIIRSAIQFLKENFEAQPILTSGVVTTTIGVLHKLLKGAEKLLEYVAKKSEDSREGW